MMLGLPYFWTFYSAIPFYLQPETARTKCSESWYENDSKVSAEVDNNLNIHS